MDKKSRSQGAEEKSGFGKENNAFTGQNNFSQPEGEMEKKQPDTEDYHRRRYLRAVAGKGNTKQVQKEHRGSVR